MDYESKYATIENMKDEVKELHPLLRAIFSSMENINEVDYTHGLNEMGADFILTKFDPTLGRNHYVGVVAKMGKILGATEVICKQIDECSLPRKIQGGKVEVRLTEIWVINNSTISNKAKDKFFEKFKNQRIEFISIDKLTELVDKYAPYYWYEIANGIGGYLQDLSKRLERQDAQLSILSGLGCNEFYISPEIQEVEKARYIKKSKPPKPRLVHIFTEVLSHKISFLEGEMGFGKSKTARQIAIHLCAPEKYKQNPVIPIFDTLINIFDKKQSLQKTLEIATNSFFDLKTISENKVIFILDGVDETIGKYANWEDNLIALINEAKSNPRFFLMLTSRPLRQLGEQATILAGVKRYVLRPLSVSKLVAFIEKACEKISIPKRLFEDLQKSDLFKQLPHSPIAAALLSRLIAQNSTDLPSNLTELYSKSIENLLGRWDIAKGSCTEKEYRDAEQVTLDLADFLISNHIIYISQSEARDRIMSWHNQRNTNTNLHNLLERVFEKSGLFTVDSDVGTLSFRHRSFGEFLYALNCNKRHKLLPVEYSFDPYWVNVQFFLTGLLGDCEDHLQKLLDYETTTELELWLKTLVMPDYFLAGYQTPYHIVEKNLFKLFVNAANLYVNVKKGETKTKLNELAEMHLLWLFQKIIRNAYEYDFFKRAITATILQIDKEEISDEIKYFALFFAACFAAELDDPSGLEYLVKTYGAEKLPLQISLGITFEQKYKKDFSKIPLIKEHVRKLNSMLKPTSDKLKINAKNQNSDFKDLFDKPLKNRLRSNDKN